MDKNDYLEVLGFSRTSNPTHDELKKAWKTLCHKHHPDKGGDEEEFKKVTHAFKMLTDIQYQVQNAKYENVDLDLRIQFPLTFEEAFAGKVVVKSYSVVELGSDNKVIDKENVETETITYEIPEGAFGDSSFVIKHKGLRKGEARGNLLLIPVHIPSQEFTAVRCYSEDGWDIHSKRKIPLHDLLVGGKVDVLTMKGVHKIKVPPGSTPGTKIKIPGKGCLGGDHVVILDVIYPDKNELKGKKWADLKIDWNPESKDEEEEDLMNLFRRIANG